MFTVTTRLAHGLKDRIYRHVVDRSYDRKHGVTTNGVHWPAELNLSTERAMHAVEYYPSPTTVVRRAIASVPGPLERFSFVDLGAGKGRILLLAADFPFRRIEGVELSPDLHRIALQNIAAMGSRADRIVARQIDAVDYAFPDGPFVLYLFNPFDEVIVSRVLLNLGASLRQSPREVYVLYVNARHRQMLDAADFLQPLERSFGAHALDRLISPWPLAFYRTRHKA